MLELNQQKSMHQEEVEGNSALSAEDDSDAKPAARFIELAVLCVAFYVASQLFDVNAGENLLLHMVIYTMVVMLSIFLSQKWFCSYKSISEVAQYVIADAVGILAGTSAVLMLQSYVVTSFEVSAAVVLASIVSFFVLGTITPLVRSQKLQKKTGSYTKKPVARY